ncbi:hypothetical protein [Prescottella subtropica]|uniref:hypothetical protein n=1 Tax=Prescottella subtropica TaxID=2545757 RepID=UPI0010F89B31|nr:hypothetical protein [Prescottella subtropica]
MNRRDMWVQMVNPARVGHDADSRYARLTRWHDRADNYLWVAGIVVAAVVFTLLVLVAPAWVAGPVAAGGAAAAVVVGRRRYRRALASARGAVRELDDTVGPATVSRSSLVDPTVRMLADQAVSAQARILGSAAYRQGSLGEPDTVTAQVTATTWQAVCRAAQLDQLVLARARLAAEIRGWRIPDAAIALEAEQADRVLAQRRQALETATADLTALADLVADFDGRLLTTAARDALRGVAGAAESAAALPDSLADDLAARISAAHHVLDAGGYTPRELPPRM